MKGLVRRSDQVIKNGIVTLSPNTQKEVTTNRSPGILALLTKALILQEVQKIFMEGVLVSTKKDRKSQVPLATNSLTVSAWTVSRKMYLHPI